MGFLILTVGGVFQVLGLLKVSKNFLAVPSLDSL